MVSREGTATRRGAIDLLYLSSQGAVRRLQESDRLQRGHVGREDREEEVVTSAEAVQRAMSHNWQEVNDQTERCTECLVIMPKATDLENVPACTGRNVFRR